MQKRDSDDMNGKAWRATAAAVRLLLLATLGGCALGQLRVAQSEHIRLTTDRDGPNSRALVRRMERDYRVLAGTFFDCSRGLQAEPLDVVALVDEVRFQSLVPQSLNEVGGFHRAPPQRIDERPPMLVMRWRGNESEMRELFRHEVTHGLIARCMPQAPAWLDEGMAEWLSTAEVEDDRVIVGRPPYYVGALRGGVGRLGDSWVVGVPRDRFIAVPAILALDRSSIWVNHDMEQTRSNYASAWALTSLLGGGSVALRQAFFDYRRELTMGGDESDAWTEHLGSLPLSEQYASFLATNERSLVAFPLDASSSRVGPIVESVLRGDEADLFWVRHMPWGTAAERHAALGILDAMEACSPERRLDSEVILLRASILLEGGDVEGAKDVLRGAGSPEDTGFARLALRLAYDYTSAPFPGVSDTLTARRADHPSREEVLALTPRAVSSFEHDVLARAWLHLEEFAAALGEAHLAVSEGGACAECWVTLGLAQIQTGDVQGGARSLDHGAALMRTSHGGRGTWVQRAGLDAYEALGRRQCEALPEVTAASSSEPAGADGDASVPASPPVTLGADPIRVVIRSHFPDVLECYHDERALIPETTGVVRVRFVIQPDGSVMSAELHESQLGGSLGCCVLGKVMTWQFPPTGGGLVSVTYPFTLQHHR